jgi:hypothetical protein
MGETPARKSMTTEAPIVAIAARLSIATRPGTTRSSARGSGRARASARGRTTAAATLRAVRRPAARPAAVTETGNASQATTRPPAGRLAGPASHALGAGSAWVVGSAASGATLQILLSVAAPAEDATATLAEDRRASAAPAPSRAPWTARPVPPLVRCASRQIHLVLVLRWGAAPPANPPERAAVVVSTLASARGAPTRAGCIPGVVLIGQTVDLVEREREKHRLRRCSAASAPRRCGRRARHPSCRPLLAGMILQVPRYDNGLWACSPPRTSSSRSGNGEQPISRREHHSVRNQCRQPSARMVA